MMKEKLWNANYIKVMTTNFLLYFAFYLLTPLLPLYLSENFGATKDVIGIVLSGYTVAALIIRPFSGYVVDSFSRKKVLMVCLTAFAIFFAGYIAASTILMFAICRTLHGGPFGAVTVANSTCAIEIAEKTGGIPSLTAVIVVAVGIFGSMAGPFILKKLGVENRIAKGLALGASAHGIGTSVAIQIGAIEGAISGLAIGIMGIMTAILVPLVQAFLTLF
jgi:MFS family permease